MVELEDIMVSETHRMEKDKYCLISLTYEIQNKYRKRHQICGYQKLVCGAWMKVVKKYKLPIIRKILMHTKCRLPAVIKMSNINK